MMNKTITRFDRRLFSNCKDCPLNGERQVQGYGPRDAKIAIIGEAPGATEAQNGIPFTGPAGRTLGAGCHDAGIVRSGCWQMNVINCRPPKNNIDSYEATQAIKCCRPGFNAELAFLKKAQVYVPVGNTSLFALTGEAGISVRRGSVFVSKTGIPIVPTFHPAMIIRQQKMWDIWVCDLTKANDIATNGWQPPKENFIIRPTLKDVREFVTKAFTTTAHLAVDTESGGFALDPLQAQLWLIGLALNDTDAICVPLWKQSIDCLSNTPEPYWDPDEESEVLLTLEHLFAQKPLLFANAKYDIRVLENSGIPVRSKEIDDVILLHHSIHPELPHNLAFIVSVYGTTPYWKDQDWTVPVFHRDPIDFRTYNSRDAVTLHQVWKPLLTDSLEDPRNHSVYKDITRRLTRPVAQMEQSGIRLDKNKLAAWKKSVQTELASLEQELKQIASVPDCFNMGSAQDLMILFYNFRAKKYHNALRDLPTKKKKNTKVYKKLSDLVTITNNTSQLWDYTKAHYRPFRTDSGIPATNETARLSLTRAAANRVAYLEKITRKTPAHTTEESQCRKLLTFLKTYSRFADRHKMESTYTSFSTDPNNIVHFPFMIHGTASGRLSSGDKKNLHVGNAQNIPEEARVCFCARPNNTLFGRDYENLELRIAAYITNEPKLIQAFKEGQNVHSANCKIIFETDEDSPDWKAARGATKIYNFGRLLYGGTLEGIFRQLLIKVPELGLTMAKLKKIDQKMMDTYPTLFTWQEEIKKQALATRKVANAFGRVRIFRGDPQEIVREALNHPIQSTAADIVNMATIRIHDCFTEIAKKAFCSLILQIHDELIGECLHTLTSHSMAIMKEEMERPVKINNVLRTFPTSGKTGKRWSDLK